MTPKRRQQGFTLIELLVVVAILGSLAAAVSVYMRPQRSVMDSANLLADSVREAARKAFGSGPVPAAFAARGIDYRTRVVSDGTVVTLWELDVNQPTAPDPFRAVKTVRLVTADNQSTPTGWKAAAQVDDGTSAAAPAITPGLATFNLKCWPDGHCDAATVYFIGPNGTRARTIILPLGGAVIARRGW